MYRITYMYACVTPLSLMLFTPISCTPSPPHPHPLPPTPTQTVVHHVLLWGSVLFTFLFNYVYTAIDSQQKFMDTYWVMQAASTRPQFWFLLLLAPVVCLLPRSVTLSSVAVYYYTLYVHVLHINTIGIISSIVTNLTSEWLVKC